MKLFEFRNREQAVRLQVELSRFVIEETPSVFKPKILCGLDMAYLGEQGFASAVLWDMEALKVVDTASSEGLVRVGYLPGLLGYREGPLMVRAARKLRTRVDGFLVDGHGRAHPRRFGLACHVGLALNRPTVGVAKSPFYGSIEGDCILGPDGEVLGSTVRADNGRAFYVSVGHRINLEDATHLVRKCLVNNHPAPLREAHVESARLRRHG